jgi:transposase
LGLDARRWLASLKFDQAVHHIVLEDCIAAVEAAIARRDRLEAHIEAALPEWSLAPVVEALQALRGVRLVAAATLVAELGDITRFTNPRQLMAYLGLVPSERSVTLHGKLRNGCADAIASSPGQESSRR